MISRVHTLTTMLAALLAANVAVAQPAEAERAGDSGTSSADAKLLKDVLERLQHVETELLRLKAEKGQAIPAEKQRVLTLVETPYLGAANNTRYLALRLVFVNLTPKDVTLEPKSITLDADGQTIAYKEVPQNIRYYGFQIGNQSHQLQNVKPAAKLSLRPGGTGSTWTVFLDVPGGNRVPQLTLNVPVEGEKNEVDVNDHARRLLELEVERIGPMGSLGLVTIGGSFNTINAGELVEALDDFASQKVARAVIRFQDAAPALDSSVWQWLQQSAATAGRGGETGNANSQFPAVPARLRELHLANVPEQNQGRRSYRRSLPYGGNVTTQGRIHDTDVEAVTAAMASAYEVLPREQLLGEIRNGHPLTRAAAITGGGGRLSADELPLLLEYAAGDDPDLQRAAIGALRHFGEKPALDALHQMVQKNVEPTAGLAIESLARSRFAAAHEILLDVLNNEPPQSKVEIVGILARYPRPIWAETVLELVEDANPSVAQAALAALVQIGHPQLFAVLKRYLEDGPREMREQAYSVLVGRTDPESEELALAHTLEKLKNEPPTPPMLNLLARTKDPRAVPLLLKHFESAKTNRQQLVQTLAQVGDETVAEVFAEKYPDLDANEQGIVLRVLQQMKSPKFHELAAKAVLTDDNNLVNQACDALRIDATAKSVEILADVLKKSGSSSSWSYATNALQQLATSEAMRALFEARRSGNERKQQYANNAINNVYQRSPANGYLYQARREVQNENFDEAIKHFNVAVKVDPELPPAYAERGNVYLRQEKAKAARQDFEKALDIDAWNSQALTGLAIVMCIEGAYEEGIEFAEDNLDKHPNDAVYAYNLACVYGRALEKVKANEDVADREAKIETYTNRAIAELERAKQRGFNQLDWMKKDPDLKALREEPRFVRIHTPQNRKPERPPQPGAEGAAERDVPAPVPAAPVDP